MDPVAGGQGFFQRWGWMLLLGGGVFFAGYLLFGRKNAASANQSATPGVAGMVAKDASGQPIVEFVPTTGDSYTNINTTNNRDSNNTTDNTPVTNVTNTTTNSNNPVTNPTNVIPVPVPVLTPPPGGGDGGDHHEPVPPPIGHTPFPPGPHGCPTGWHLASDNLCHLLPLVPPSPPPSGPPISHPPVPPTPPPPVGKPPTPAPIPAPKPVSKSYTIGAGDTLSGIAGRFHTTWQALYNANKGVIDSTASSHGNPIPGGPWNNIFPGETIQVPA